MTATTTNRQTLHTRDGLTVTYTHGTASLVRLACSLADEGGTIQAHDMLRLSDDPRQHAATSLTGFLRSIGAEIIS